MLQRAASMKTRSPYKAGWFSQFRAVLWRSWLSVMREPMVLKVRFIQSVVRAYKNLAKPSSPNNALVDCI